MISFLFWNLAKKAGLAPYVTRIAKNHAIDVFLFAECPRDTSEIIAGLGSLDQGSYHEAGITPSKIRAFTRIKEADFDEAFTNSWGDLTVWRFRTRRQPDLLIASVHLP